MEASLIALGDGADGLAADLFERFFAITAYAAVHDRRPRASA